MQREVRTSAERVTAAAGEARPPRICLLVLGMHRSGTSAMTRVASLLGADLPRTPIGPLPSNERGHWEPAPIVSHHDHLLERLGSRWDDWRRLDMARLATAVRAEAERAFHALVEEEYAASPLFVLKDPRICRFVPFVTELLQAQGSAVRHILVLRNPLAVAASLEQRDGMAPGFAALVWLRHVLDAEAATRHVARAVVSYESLLVDWRAVMRSVGARTGVRWPRPIEACGPQVDACLSNELQHHAPSARELAARGDVAVWVKDAYAALRALERDADDEAAVGTLDRIAAEFNAAAPAFAAAIFPELAARDAKLIARDAEIASLRGEIARQASNCDALRAEAEAGKARAAELSGALSRHETEAWGLRAELLAARTELDAVRGKLNALQTGRALRIGRFIRGLLEGGPVRSALLDRTRRLLRRVPVPVELKHRLKMRLSHFGVLPDALVTVRNASDTATSRSQPACVAPRHSVEAAYLEQVLALAQPVASNVEYVPRMAEAANLVACPVKAVAFYLPQFHPIPENDRWWGKGFTEWSNVAKAVPQFVGHHQPRLPADLGFYDLRLRETQRQQIELARQYGVYGFCYHYYWFAGRRLLDLPLRRLMEDTALNLPFCVCWANENWTRRWDGQDEEILIAQSHSAEDDLAFIRELAPVLRDPRYIRFAGRPLLIVYRVSLLPEPRATAARWRDYCVREGIGDPYLVAAQSFDVEDPRPYGFDAALEFPPHRGAASRLHDTLPIVNPSYAGNIYDYRELARHFMSRAAVEYALLKTVMPSWDNEARRPGRGHTYWGSSPAEYARWLRAACSAALSRSQQDGTPPFVFINAWNEWAEAAYIEPDRKFGYAICTPRPTCFGNLRRTTRSC